MAIDWGLIETVAGGAALAALVGIAVLLFVVQRRGRRGTGFLADAGSGATLLFDGEALIDSTPAGRALLSGERLRGGPWLRMLAALSPRFPDLEAALARLAADGSVTLASAAEGDDPPLMLQAELRGGLTRISVNGPGARGMDPLGFRALTDELAQLRQTFSLAPVLIWRERPDGEVIWANAPYLRRAVETLPRGQDLSWPLPRLFERGEAESAAEAKDAAAGTAAAGKARRQKIDLPGGPAWYDIARHDGAGGWLVFASPADAAVQAELALRDFMQTLTKTFAQLPIGLAIFDKQRQLQMFNPALLDLTGLSAGFLSMRPSLLAVLDALRDRKMIPEPKDYRGWRRQLVELEKAAAAGDYEETWSLPGGQTYRVMGRPHPNGGLALMLEDISTEMSRTRRYRADLELGQSVIDELGEAIAVFSQAGQLVMSNAAYARLWGHDPAATLGEVGLRNLSAHWRALSAPSPIWTEAEDFAATGGDRQAWAQDVRLLDGRLISCRFAPLAGGATLAAFRPATSEDQQSRLADATAANARGRRS